MSRLTGGLATRGKPGARCGSTQAALQGIDPATIEASARQLEELNTQMAIAETVSAELAQGATELGAALTFEGVDEAGARLTEMLQSLVQGLTEAIIQALIFRAIMAGISGTWCPHYGDTSARADRPWRYARSCAERWPLRQGPPDRRC